jgi:hypothetical protein
MAAGGDYLSKRMMDAGAGREVVRERSKCYGDMEI